MKRETKTKTRKTGTTSKPAQPAPAAPRKGVAGFEGRRRVVIEGVRPEVDGGRFPIKRVMGESVVVEADIFADGHDEIAGVLRFRHERATDWSETPVTFVENDRWRASFEVPDQGRYYYTLTAWVDHFRSWQRDMRKRTAAGQDVAVDLLIGRDLVRAAAQRAAGSDRKRLEEMATAMEQGNDSQRGIDAALSDELTILMATYEEHPWPTVYERELAVVVDRDKAGFSAWYEMFPRSTSGDPQRHGTFKDCEARLPYIAELGFDVLYLPPIHPIGRTFRKGKNNQPDGGSDAIGSPWAIGSEEGGHTAIHRELGTLEDFRRLMAQAKEQGLEMAMDLAFQCSPDHPYVKQHPEWFVQRPDGTIQYAENPPKKYQDIYPLNFESEDWEGLWQELRGVIQYWIDQGVRIFRVDNPHTKAFPFWTWCIADIKRDHPDVLFLAEAFTRPKVMYRLAKLGFTQSYTYFAWRQTKSELTQYFTELTKTEVREYFRPNLWPNTPDILTDQLQHGGRPAFMTRFVLAATLGANYGIYGPAFELLEHQPLKPGSEEYLNSEKYEMRQWDLHRSDSLAEFIGRVNRVRREHRALWNDRSLIFHPIDNPDMIAYSKRSADGKDCVLVVVNLSPHYVHSGWVHLELDALEVQPDRPFQVADLLTNAYYSWQGSSNYVQLDPHSVPAHIFVVRSTLRSEHDFDYFM